MTGDKKTKLEKKLRDMKGKAVRVAEKIKQLELEIAECDKAAEGAKEAKS